MRKVGKACLDEAEAALARAQASLAEYRASLLHAACTGQVTAAWRASRPGRVEASCLLPLLSSGEGRGERVLLRSDGPSVPLDHDLDERGLCPNTPSSQLSFGRRGSSSHPAEDGPALLRRILAERRVVWERAELARLHARGKPAPVGEAWKARYHEPEGPDVGGLPKLPHDWTWASLDQLCAIVGGVTVDAKRAGDDLLEVPYLRVANVQRGHLDLSQVKTIRASAERAEALRLLPNDILLNEGGDRDKVGRGWVWGGQLPDCIHQNHVFRARPYLADMDGRFVSHCLNEMGRAYFLDAAIQTTDLASISMTKVSRVPVPVPSLIELQQIMRMIKNSLEEAEAGGVQISAIATLRQSIFHATFTGHLVPQDPASALLARLRNTPATPRRPRASPSAEAPA